MDLRLYASVLRRFRLVLALGVIVAAGLAVLSYANVSFNGGRPELTPRAKEVWQSQAVIFLTEPGFPAGRRKIDVVPVQIGDETVLQGEQNTPATYTALTGLYAKLAGSDEVTDLMRNDGKGPLLGSFSAIPTADTTYRRAEPLPMLSLFGTGSTPQAAVSTAARGTSAFLRYVDQEQRSARIPNDKRVVIETINAPQTAQLIVPRKKTLPFVVFFAVMFASVALAFVLENLRPRRTASEPMLVDVRRSA